MPLHTAWWRSGLLNSIVTERVWKTIPIREGQSPIHDIIMADRRVMEHFIATELGISQDSIHTVIHNEFHESKVSAHCVSKLFAPDLKRTRLNMSRENLWGRRKEGNILYNDTLNTFYLWLYGIRHMVKDHSDSERRNPLLPHRLLFPN